MEAKLAIILGLLKLLTPIPFKIIIKTNIYHKNKITNN